MMKQYLEINGWTCMDSDSFQYCKYKGERVYSFIQIVWLDSSDNNRYAICTDDIDLKNFFYHDLEMAINGFYNNLTDLEEKYQLPIGQLDDLIAKCYFENNCLVDSYSLGGVYTLDEAEKTVKSYIKTH